MNYPTYGARGAQPEAGVIASTGYDLVAGTLVLHSETRARYVTPLRTFERTWARADRWAVVILPPNRLPATADEPMVLPAASGLERAGRHAEVATAYVALLRRWPAASPLGPQPKAPSNSRAVPSSANPWRRSGRQFNLI
ncbi:MAG: hypothetical protein ACRDGN_01075 [bacterium]